jgi:pimeloyl-ACP methyl ester carboxylesterase
MMEKRHVAVRGGMFLTEVHEVGSGPPLLFLHGVRGVEPDAPFLERLAQHYRVIAPYLPGYAESSGTEHLRDLHDLIYYELDLLDALGLRHVPLVGHSLGGMVAAELSAVQPDRFSALVLIAPFGLWNPAYPVADFFAMSPEQLAAATYHDPQSPAAQAAAHTPADQEGYIAFMLDRAKALATAAKYLWPIPNRGLASRLHRVAAPTLLVWGESDRIVPPRYAQDFQEKIATAQVAIIPAAGHLPEVEQLDRTAEVVLRFLATSAAEASQRTAGVSTGRG